MKHNISRDPSRQNPLKRDAVAGIFRALVTIWRELFPWEQIAHDSHFFALGADSLHVQALRVRIREQFGVEVPAKAIFDSPLLSQIARAIAANRNPSTRPALAAHTPAPHPLSLNQKRFWQVYHQRADRPANRFSISFRIVGHLEASALESAFSDIIRRHHVLRTAYGFNKGEVQGQVCDPPQTRISWFDLSQLSETERTDEANRLVREEKQRPYELDGGALARVSVILLSRELHLLLLNMHGLSADERSFSLFSDELWSRYQGHLDRRPLFVNELPVQYSDYVIWQQEFLKSETMDRQLLYWRAKLSNHDQSLRLPIDRARPRTLRFQGEVASFHIPEILCRGMKGLGEGYTPFVILLTALKILMMRYSGQKDVAVVAGSLNRPDKRLESLIGLFQNRLILRTDLSGGLTVLQLLKRVQQTVAEALDHQEVPFGWLCENLHEGGPPVHYPVLFEYRHGRVHIPEISGLKIEMVPAPLRPARFDINLQITPAAKGEKGIQANLEYNARIFKKETILRMIEHYRTLLADMIAVPNGRIDDLNLLTAREWKRILDDREISTFPGNRCLNEAFRLWAARCPERVALVYRRQNMTWDELERRSNRLAWLLREQGVTAGKVVAIKVESQLDYLLSVLAVLAVGGVCLPLSNQISEPLTCFFLEDSGAGHLICDRDQETPVCCNRIRLDREEMVLDRRPEAAILGGPGLDQRAFLLYSAVQGERPLGLCLTHQGLIRLFEATRRQFSYGPGDIWCLSPEADHELAICQMWGALLHGGRLVLVDRKTAAAPHAFFEMLRESRVTMLWLNTHDFLALAAFENSLATRPALTLRFVVLSGEPLEPGLSRDWFRCHTGERPQLVYAFGCLEAGIFASLQPLNAGDPERGETCLLGKRLDDMLIILMDSGLFPVPRGVYGEIAIGGVALARGYHGHPAETALRFVPNPLGIEAGERIFRSGALGRYTADGNIEYLGRSDRKVQLRGRWVDPAGLERLLNRIPGVAAVHTHLRVLYPGGRQLTAWLAAGEQFLQTQKDQDLINFLSRKMLPHQLPVFLVLLAQLPRTLQGEIDPRALPRPQGQGLDQAFDSPMAQTISSIWQRLLQIEQPGADQNFFEVGGDAFLACRLRSELAAAFGINLPADIIFRANSINQQMQFISLNNNIAGEAASRISPHELAAEIEALGLVEEVLVIDQGQSVGKCYRIAYLVAKSESKVRPKPEKEVRTPGGTREDLENLTAAISTLTAHHSTEACPVNRSRLSNSPACERLISLISCLDDHGSSRHQDFFYQPHRPDYPLQTYLYLGQDCIEGLRQGFYYHHPQHCCIYRIESENQPEKIVDQGFFLALVANNSSAETLIEAGRICQCLETWASILNIELSGTAEAENDLLQLGFSLSSDQRMVYGLKGSVPGPVSGLEPDLENDLISQVIAGISERVAADQMPDAWHLVSRLPDIAQDSFETCSNLSQSKNEIPESGLLNLFRESSGLEDLDPMDDYHRMGLSSLKLIHTLGRIQAALGKSIPISEMYRATSVRELVLLLRCAEGPAHEVPISMSAPKKSFTNARTDKLRRLI